MRPAVGIIRGPSLYRHPCRKCAAVFSGVTDTETRKARMREAILERGLADAICGKRGGNVETFRAVFQRIYSEAL